MFRLYPVLMWLADRLVWLACFCENPKNPAEVRRCALRSMTLLQKEDYKQLFGKDIEVNYG